MIVLLLNLMAVMLNRIHAWVSDQSTPRLILLFQAVLLALYLTLALVAFVWMSPSYSYTFAIRLAKGVSPEKVWDHMQDVTKNPVSANQCVQTTIIKRTLDDNDDDNDDHQQQHDDHQQQHAEEWHEVIGGSETIRCCTNRKETIFNERLVRDCWADAVSLKGQVTYLLSTKEVPTNDDTIDSKEKKSSETTKITILRMFVTIEAEWGSFLTPLLRLVLTCRQKILEQAIQDYLERLCRDMGVAYQTAEAWE